MDSNRHGRSNRQGRNESNDSHLFEDDFSRGARNFRNDFDEEHRSGGLRDRTMGNDHPTSYGRGSQDYSPTSFEQNRDRFAGTGGYDAPMYGGTGAYNYADLGSDMGRSEHDRQTGRYSGRGPKGYARSDERIREDVCERLEHDSHVDASEIEVRVEAGVVTLTGHVEDRRTKKHAEAIIDHLRGVKDVRNELKIDQSFFQQVRDVIMGESDETRASRTGHSKSVSKH
jgi:hypothetical protein